MYVAISSGASPSRSNLKVTILWLWVSNWHSTILSPVLHTCRVNTSITLFRVTLTCLMCSLLEYISATYIEHTELWPGDLLLTRTSACGSAVVFAHFPFTFSSMNPFITIAQLLPWRGIRVDTVYEKKRRVNHCKCFCFFKWIPEYNSKFRWAIAVGGLKYIWKGT